jgi:hypothetical protein
MPDIRRNNDDVARI